MKKKQKKDLVVLLLIIGSIYLLSNTSRSASIRPEDGNAVLYLGFNDPANPWKDSSGNNHVFTVVGNPKLNTDTTFCKFGTCADFSALTGDYIQSTTKFTTPNGMAISFWSYPTSAEQPFGYFMISTPPINGDNYQSLKWCQESNYGTGCEFTTTTGRFSASTGESNKISNSLNQWRHYFIQYNGTNIMIWRNGILVTNKLVSATNAPLISSIGELLKIGNGVFEIDTHGYLDEFIIYAKADFTDADVMEYYNELKLGNPPGKDVYVKNIKYDLPINWATHKITVGTMPIEIILRNAGTLDSGSFTYNFRLGSNTVCSGATTLAGGQEKTIVCNWGASKGYHTGEVTLTIADENLANNKQSVYIPFLDRPYMQFSLDEWQNEFQPYLVSSAGQANSYLKKSYDWAKSYNNPCTYPFPENYPGDKVDPFGGCTRTMALSCLANNYIDANGRTQCAQAIGYLKGWASRPIDTYSSVQATHQLAHVGLALDIMFPLLSEAEWNDLITKYSALCMKATTMGGLYTDDSNRISGGNGWGFGSGHGSFCYSLIGSNKDNPTLIYKNEMSYWGESVMDMWLDRDTGFIEGRKDDEWSQYQEGWNYKMYAESHILDNMLFERRFNIINVEKYNNAFCAMGREVLTNMLDLNYNGKTLRNDKDMKSRFISRGDSESYYIDSSMWMSWDMLFYYASLCDDDNTKASLLYLADKIALNNAPYRYAYPSLYLYKDVRNDVSPKDPTTWMPKFIYDNANDIAMWRDGYTYATDTVFQIDAGEERGSGHSFAQGYFLYALGEPFFDYEQVSYEDDVKMDVWKNGVSFRDMTQTVEGTGGVWNNQFGQAGYNQYYGGGGMSDYYTSAYPDFKSFPLEYSGDIEDYFGSTDGEIGGAYVWRPYKGATQPVKEYFIKVGDVVIKRTTTSGVTDGSGIYNNFININDEFTETRSGTEFVLNRVGTNKNMKTAVIYSSTPVTLGGGKTNIAYCFCKTSCTGSCRGLGTYRRMYYYSADKTTDLIFYHNWYYDNNAAQIESVTTGVDKGAKIGTDTYVIFDSNEDGKTIYGFVETDGWGLIYSDSQDLYVAFDSTYIKKSGSTVISSTYPIVNYKKGYDIQTNSMTRSIGIDVPAGSAPPPGPDCTPTAEICDGVDNDCDTIVDNGVTNACGGCGAVPTEICDSIDNDCDGSTDEVGCTCTTGTTRACGIDTGACVKGIQTCVAGAWSTTCSGSIAPVTEVCDGADNDCDGSIDENVCSDDRNTNNNNWVVIAIVFLFMMMMFMMSGRRN